MRRLIVLMLTVAVGACGQASVYSGWSKEKTAEKADIADANARTALMRIAELEDRVTELESQVSDLTDRGTPATTSEVQEVRDRVDTLESAYNNHTH